MELENYIRSVPDFPKSGIDFKDISPLLADPGALDYTIDALADLYDYEQIDRVAAFDARGFIFGALLAIRMKKPFIPIRKAGKLPYDTVSQSYGLEYGKDTIEMHTDALQPKDNILLIDDLLATGGTMKVGCELVESLEGKVVGCGFVIDTNIGGIELLDKYDVRSLIQY